MAHSRGSGQKLEISLEPPWGFSVLSMQWFRVRESECLPNESQGLILLVGSGDHTLRTTRWKGWPRDRSVLRLPLPGLHRPHPRHDTSALQPGDVPVLRSNVQASAGHADSDQVLTPPLSPRVSLGEPPCPYPLGGEGNKTVQIKICRRLCGNAGQIEVPGVILSSRGGPQPGLA